MLDNIAVISVLISKIPLLIFVKSVDKLLI